MPNLKTPRIYRFENPFEYSDTKEKAIEQFMDDISKLYLFGYNREKIKKRATTPYEFINNKFKMDGKGSNISLDAIIEFVFAQDYISHSFGYWIEFEYYIPLKIYLYAKAQKEDNDFNFWKMSSLIFSLIVAYKQTAARKRNYGNETKNLKRIIDTNPANSERAKVALEFLKNHKEALLFYAPQRLYDTIDIAQVSFRKYCEILGLEIYYRDRIRNSKGEMSTTLYISGIKRLWNKVNAVKKGVTISINDIKTHIISGCDLKKDEKEIYGLWQKYETHTIRNKYQFFGFTPMKNNPLIRVTNKGKIIYCKMPSDFANYAFIFKSLYFNPTSGKPKDMFARIIQKDASSNKRFLQRVSKELQESGIGKQTNKSSFYKKFKEEEHFKQIGQSFKVIQKISENGIPVDIKEL